MPIKIMGAFWRVSNSVVRRSRSLPHRPLCSRSMPFRMCRFGKTDWPLCGGARDAQELLEEFCAGRGLGRISLRTLQGMPSAAPTEGDSTGRTLYSPTEVALSWFDPPAGPARLFPR